MPDPMTNKLVLVADDESHIVHVVSLKLRNAGFEVVTAADGEEAYELACRHLPCLVVTDYQMPYMTGLELCRRLRENPATSHIPALMLTARGYSLAQDDLDKTNIGGVLGKPFSPREVLDLVNELIQGKIVETS